MSMLGSNILTCVLQFPELGIQQCPELNSSILHVCFELYKCTNIPNIYTV